MPDKILIVDDEPELLTILRRSLAKQGMVVQTATSGEAAWALLAETMFDCVVCDLTMTPMDGLGLLKLVRSVDNVQPFIIMTGAGSIETAVEAIRLGAFHYITKPFKTQELELLIRRAVEHGHLHRKLEDFETRDDGDDFGEMVIGNSAMMQQMMNIVDKVSESDASILIQGETGTGKSLLARRIHKSSPRADKPIFIIDCGALSEQILESELFGHVKGAFTGAVRAKRGLMEEAQGGTLFLDEIGELTPATQVKLLRAIQEREIKPVGGNVSVSIDVRFLSATSRDLEQEVESGGFRRDLYYRLAVIPVRLPPLRERKDDLLLFVDYFVRKFNARYNKKITALAPSAMQMLLDSTWKGNIRELENIVERAVLLTSGDTIALDALCVDVRNFGEQDQDGFQDPVPLKLVVEKAEIGAIRQALAIAGGNRSKAAQILGIGRRTLYSKLEAYNL